VTRSDFILGITGVSFGMNTLKDLSNLKNSLPTQGAKMPVLFIGHGSPMNGIEDTQFSAQWKKLGKEIPQPNAVLCVSAHWLTHGTYVTAMSRPKTIHDFGGFPQELFQVQYPAPGSPSIAKETAALIHQTNVGLDHDWGLDHGCWTVVKHMYPEANIPVLQLSIDYNQPANYHYSLSKELQGLRKKGVLIIGSGNMVHNLRMIAWDKFDVPEFGFDWAQEMNDTFKKLILSKEHKPLLDYQSLGKAALLAVPSPDHYYPLIYSLALQDDKDEVEFFNDRLVAGSLTMTSVKISS
jgi:4,5-DOPA dioxygenase extradiol